MILLRALGLTLLFLMASLLPSNAEADLRAIIAKFATGTSFSATEAVVRELAATGDPAVELPLSALADGNLYIRKADSQVFVGKDAGDGIDLLDPLSGEKSATAAKADLTKIKVNN
ncbi:MAG: urea ABC transporter permease subunit UrtB, partial [Mesorhizobium sp.]